MSLDEVAVKNFIKYLQFPTVHPSPDYTAAVDWLRNEGRQLGLTCKVTELVTGNPLLVMCWQGQEPQLPGILLNSHMDVVPVNEANWTHPPFGAEMDEKGNIFARGSQDMKCVGIQQLEAVRRLLAEGFTPRRTVYLTFVPDEELGGAKGMRPFVEGKLPDRPDAPHEITFAEMNVGLCMDEGLASPTDEYVAFYEERSPWWMEFCCHGDTGHGSVFIENTAVQKLHYLMTKFLDLRQSEKHRLDSSAGELGLGEVTTVNITKLDGGLQVNIVPSKLTACVDCRLPPTLDFNEFQQQVDSWVKEAGPGVEVAFLNKDMGTTGHGCLSPIPPDVNTDQWWRPLSAACARAGVKLRQHIFPGATDARYLRRYHRLPCARPNAQPIQAVNFSPMRRTPVLLHCDDEFLNKDEFLAGCQLYTDLLRELTQVAI